MDGGAVVGWRGLMRASGKYGVWLYRFGVVVHGDGRRRLKLLTALMGRDVLGPGFALGAATRREIRGWSKASARRLAFVAANADVTFATHLTLTYRARTAEWEIHDIGAEIRRLCSAPDANDGEG